MKPLLADVMQRFPEAEVTLEREQDVLNITTDKECSSAVVGGLLVHYGVDLASFLKDGTPVEGQSIATRSLPWLAGLEEGADTCPTEIAARKEAWIMAHPEEYEQWLHTPLEIPERQ